MMHGKKDDRLKGKSDTCVLSCPYGAVVPDGDGHAADKCELCTQSTSKKPACVEGCPNRAIVFEERT